MSLFKNNHVATAMVVAPLLAVISYLLVDSFLKEPPHVAVAGRTYPLVAQSNCRYSSGQCDLVNTDFKAVLTADNPTNMLLLSASHSLERVTLGLVDRFGKERPPIQMKSLHQNDMQWAFDLPAEFDSGFAARLVLQASGAHYYVETSMQFVDYQTTFKKDLRQTQ